MIVYMENLHMYDLFSENDKSGKTLYPLHVSDVLENLYFQFIRTKLFLRNLDDSTVQQLSTLL
jgi:hypothetical protein